MVDPYIGEIVLFAFQFAPHGWANCAGQLMPISMNIALFSLINCEFGGDCKSTFALPDYRSIAPQGMQYCIALQGVSPSKEGSPRPESVGEIAILPYNYAPSTWTECTGQLLPISGNEALFQVLGTKFGGDGETTFGLPDLIMTQPLAPQWSGQEDTARTTSLYFITNGEGSAPAQPFLAEVGLFPFNEAPAGWMTCEGQLLPINQNQALFSLLGTTYGGNGETNFALPNLRDLQVPAGTQYCIATQASEDPFPARVGGSVGM
jgi:microcystin-dependent protein